MISYATKSQEKALNVKGREKVTNIRSNTVQSCLSD